MKLRIWLAVVAVALIGCGIHYLLTKPSHRWQTRDQLQDKYGLMCNFQPRKSFVWLYNPNTRVLVCTMYDSEKDVYQVLSTEKVK